MDKSSIINTIIVLSGRGAEGKSSTIRQIALQLSELNCQVINDEQEILDPIEKQRVMNAIANQKSDFILILKIGEVVIGIASQGDPNTHLDQKLNNFFEKYKCTLIICASRSSGATVRAIQHYAKQYNIIWTSTYRSSQLGQHQMLNELKARHVLQLIKELNII